MRTVEDKSGNLWFGTWGGGVSKYDGKSFTTYSVAQGLSSNDVFSFFSTETGFFGLEQGKVLANLMAKLLLITAEQGKLTK